ncbi:MAG: hypothetical protein ABSG85_16340 [Spirochaetia bacterium]|jgi:hypothetical protein
MVPGIGRARADLAQAIEDLGTMLRDSQAMAMKTAEKLLKAGVQQAVQDASLGAQIDLTA